MLEEAITITIIIGGCAAAAWYAKNKFQPEIERNLARLERPEAVKEFVYRKHKDP
jgi:hypothetical protein